MEFLGVGYQELLLVMVLVLIFVGPERMPTVAYQIGRAVRQMQRYARAVRDEFSEEISYVEEQYKTIKGEVDVTAQSLREQQRKLQSEMKDATAGLDTPLLPADSSPANILAFNPPASTPAPVDSPPAETPAAEKPPATPLVF
ncbi:MAG: twin-arginine translocase subunit TatB [Chloroflexi bacterium]|nr:twin-arginine translocase subunit TatB [Chloroflexota bacterium]